MTIAVVQAFSSASLPVPGGPSKFTGSVGPGSNRGHVKGVVTKPLVEEHCLPEFATCCAALDADVRRGRVSEIVQKQQASAEREQGCGSAQRRRANSVANIWSSKRIVAILTSGRIGKRSWIPCSTRRIS